MSYAAVARAAASTAAVTKCDEDGSCKFFMMAVDIDSYIFIHIIRMMEAFKLALGHL